MGLENFRWKEDFFSSLHHQGINTSVLSFRSAELFRLNENEKLLIHLISVSQVVLPEKLVEIQEEGKKRGVQVIHLWEDVWRSRPEQVLGRLSSVLGLNHTVHGRKTKIVEVSQETANSFFEQYHLQGTAGCKFRCGLELDQRLVAVAGFSAKRPMHHTPGYTSAELIRFATVNGFTVTGGLSKLIRHFIKTAAPNDIMSYADMDWSDGNGYTRLGFTAVARTPPMHILLHSPSLRRFLPHRLPAVVRDKLSVIEEDNRLSYLKTLHYTPVYNSGNIKYILYL